MIFTNVLGFLLNFSTSWKSCVKEQWPKKSSFWNFWLNVMICDSRPKRGWNVLRSLKSLWMNGSTKDTQIWISYLLLVNKSGAKAVNSQSWTFETNYTQKWHFYAVPGHKQQPDNQTIKFWHQVSKFRGGHNFWLPERVLWGWLAGPWRKKITMVELVGGGSVINGACPV